MEIYNTLHGQYVASDTEEWSDCEPQARLRDAVFQHIADASPDIGDAIVVGKCYQWTPAPLPSLYQLRDAVTYDDWNAEWLSDITQKMAASFKEHMQNAVMQWMAQNCEVPQWYWVRNTHAIVVTKELLMRYYREWCEYSDEEIADLYFGDEVPA